VIQSVLTNLSAGEFADFTILDSNPVTFDPKKNKDIVVWGNNLCRITAACDTILMKYPNSA